ncbi:lipocalin family protein [Marinoscillum furvescens]|uniref:Lipocalin-like domain-containing protein n=1 Tax=Marinoscillum furvescens DSM 4134 TaxID=1122208 RepID=A0A3D9KZ65_MARFU|nr:lipocalin family protein [Marinoscillum furvescens]RED92035.1 hypothetical protein C7460_1334 [Marinoscillum furvescens DSM 4134]
MKNMILLLALLSLLACSEDDNKVEQETSIFGTWQLVESYIVDGVEGNWLEVENGYNYQIMSNGLFTSSKFNECDNGNYELRDETITFNYSCEGFTTGIENPPGSFGYKYSIKNSVLEIQPTYIGCFEGCGYRFRKIAEIKTEE